MSTLKQRLLDDMKSAMRNRDTTALETIRMIRAAIQRREVDERVELDDNGVLQVVQKLVKQCTDAARQFGEGGREDLVEKEQANIRVIEQYLPEPMSDTELDSLIRETILEVRAQSMKDMGKVLGRLKSQVQGRADMGVVSKRVREQLG